MQPRVLLIRFSSLGDVVLTTPVTRAIRARYPEARITFATKAVWAPIAERAPGVDHVVALAPGESVRDFAARVGGPFDRRVDLQASLRSAGLRRRLRGRWGVYRPQALRRRWMTWRHRTTPALLPVPERYLLAAREAGLDVVTDGRGAAVAPTIDDRTRAATLVTGPYVVLCPGAAHASKRWPTHHWHALANGLRARGATVVATGTTGERPLLTSPGIIDAFGLALGPTAALLGGARGVVANDSGLMHLATAVGTPVVALFGPTSPAFGYAPYRATARVLQRDLPCRPCSTHGGPRCPLGHHACMVDLMPDTVDVALRDLRA